LPNFNVNAVVVDPRDSSHLYIGTDLGAFETTNLGASWTKLDAGMRPAEIDDLNLNRSGTILTAGTYGRGMYSLFRTWIDPNVTSSIVGSVISLSGNGFVAGETVNLYWDSPGGALLGSVVAGSTGALTPANFTVPPASLGSHAIIAVGQSSGRTGSNSFTVIAPTPTTVAMQAAAGWNMVGGSPLTLWGDSVVNWTLNASTPAWYHPTGTEALGTGAWEDVSTAGPRTVNVFTCPLPMSVSVVAHRWNMVANPCAATVSLPGSSRAYRWNPGRGAYDIATSIGAGGAAWVKPDLGSLTLTPAPAAALGNIEVLRVAPETGWRYEADVPPPPARPN
jgi:hypothetical protein